MRDDDLDLIPDDDSPDSEDPTRRVLVVYARHHEEADIECFVYEHVRMREESGWIKITRDGQDLDGFREHLVQSWHYQPDPPKAA